MKMKWAISVAAAAVAAMWSVSDTAVAQTGSDQPASTSSRDRLREGEGVVGELAPAGDSDWYRFTARSGNIYTFTLVGEGEGALDDPLLILRNDDGEEIAQNDDYGGELNSRLVYVPQDRRENVYVEARGFSDEATGVYRLAATSETAPPDEASANTGTRGRMEPGNSLTGDLSFPGDKDWYRVELEAGQSYRIRLNSAESGDALDDPYLALYGADGALVAENDDGGGDLNSYLEYVAPSTSRYFIEARGFSEEATGAYVLTFAEGDIPASVDTDATASANGDYIEGELAPASDKDWYRMAMEEGQTVRIALDGVEGGLGDPLLVVYDAEGEELARNDDSGGDLNSRLEFTAPAAGDYFIEARGFLDDAEGAYTLSVMAGEVGDNTDDADSASIGAPGVSGVLSEDGDQDWYRVDLVEGRPYRIRLVSDDPSAPLDPYLTLYDGDGEEIVSDDDGGTGLDSYLSYTSVTGGRYYIGVSSYDDVGTGDFTLTVLDTDVPGNTDTDEFLSGEDGDSRTGRIEIPGDVDYFAADLSTGVRYTITLNSAPDAPLSDPALTVYAEDGSTELASDDDSGPGLNSRLTFTPTSSGRYYIKAAGRRSAIGQYTIEISH